MPGGSAPRPPEFYALGPKGISAPPTQQELPGATTNRPRAAGRERPSAPPTAPVALQQSRTLLTVPEAQLRALTGQLLITTTSNYSGFDPVMSGFVPSPSTFVPAPTARSSGVNESGGQAAFSCQKVPHSLFARITRSWAMSAAVSCFHHAPGIFRRCWSRCRWVLSTSPEPIGSSASIAPL